MSFLDDIAQRPADTRPRVLRSTAVPDAFRNDPIRVVGAERAAQPPSEPQRQNKDTIWLVVLAIVAMVATASWLGLQQMAASGSDNENAIAEDAAEAPAAPPAPARSKARRSAARRATKRAPIHAASESTSNGPAETISPAISAAVELVSDGEAVGTPEADTATADVPLLVPSIDNDNIYSRASGDVIAPKLVSLGFVGPLVNGFDVRRSSIELLISKKGTVERAKLLSLGSRNYEDAMLLSRAKNFHFAPALRYGSPVRYRFVMEVALTP